MPTGVIVLAAAVAPLSARADPGVDGERAMPMRSALSVSVPALANAAPAPKIAPAAAPAVTAAPCAACLDGAQNARPLFPALAQGESYELRILQSAVSGFSLRLSDGEGASSPDERLRIRISRQRIGIAWQRSF